MEQSVRIHIDSLTFGGAGVGRAGGKVCFVRGALPGEVVLFRVLKEKPKYIQGELEEILVASSDRVEPVCKYYGDCGGCQLQHLSYEKELVCKKEQVIETIRRIAGIDEVKCADIVPSPSPYGYRCSVTLHPSGDGYGYYRAGSREVVEIDNCVIAEDAINDVLPLVKLKGKKRDVKLKSDAGGRVWSSARPGERFFTEEYGDNGMVLSTRAFSQPNRRIARDIAARLDEWIGGGPDPDVFFDAYCGAGFFSFMLKTSFEKRIGMDSSRQAIDCAVTSLKRKRLSDRRFYRGDVEKSFIELMRREKGSDNVLLLDPPRSGAAKVFLEEIGSCGWIDRLFYLSCDTGRLARDIKVLASGGKWSPGRIQPFDMFPRTGHIETLVEFVK
ncbi:MAG: TRAM domain-containing protein [Candidatus Omnitrophica bacterium]|nr:TRAM domain-containing protein [Candidatus Omnitrophota bacterium]